MALVARWSKEAEDTFDEIIEYLENNWTEKEMTRLCSKGSKGYRTNRREPLPVQSFPVPENT